jgi:hypothetical protein
MPEIEPTEIMIEWPEQYGIRKAAVGESLDALKEESQRAMNLAMSSIRSMAAKISRAIDAIEQEARPDEVEVEFSLKLDLEGGAIVPLVAKTTAGGQFTVKYKWVLKK